MRASERQEGYDWGFKAGKSSYGIAGTGELSVGAANRHQTSCESK